MPLSFDELQKKYGGLYIAIKDDEVLASDKSINELQKKIGKLRDSRGVTIRLIKAAKIEEIPEVNGNEP